MPPALEDLLRSPTAYAVAALLGALLGSFANVVILRVPAGQSIVRPGSRCTACGAPVRWYDNFPIVSYLVLRGRCRRCGAQFSARYLFIELATALLVVGIWHLTIAALHAEDEAPVRLARFGAYTLFAVTLVAITFIDLDHKKIPDRITYPGIPVFFAFGVLLGDQPILDLAIGVVAGYGVVRLISDGYYHLTGREGLGYGDGKLLALVGGLLGWRAVMFSLFAGSCLGTFLVLPVLLLRRKKTTDPGPLRHMELPFGPFLAGGAIIYMFLQDTLRVAFAM